MLTALWNPFPSHLFPLRPLSRNCRPVLRVGPQSMEKIISEIQHLDPRAWFLKEKTFTKDGLPDKEWSTLALRSEHGKPQPFLRPLTADSAKLYRDTELLEACPELQKFVHSLSPRVYLVRLLKLTPGARVKFHSDEVAFRDTKLAARFHLPLTTNPGCIMSMGIPLNAPVPGSHIWNAREIARFHLSLGTLWYTNVNALHSVCNEGTTDRIHLVIDMAPPVELRA